MSPDVAAALERSIAHWEQVRDARHPGDVFLGPTQCALCEMFWASACCGCPVAMRTEQTGCRDTPYTAAGYALGRWDTAVIHRMSSQDRAHSEFRDAAQREIDFLVSLRTPMRSSDDILWIGIVGAGLYIAGMVAVILHAWVGSR